MSEYLIVLPVIHREAAVRCIRSMDQELRDHLIVVDNRGVTFDGRGNLAVDDMPDAGEFWAHFPQRRNIGVARSWNIGLRHAAEYRCDYLILLSHAIEFGDDGGIDLVLKLDSEGMAHGMGTQHGWQCIAIGAQCWKTIGLFDNVFGLGYFEDTDYLYRLGLAGLPSPRENGGIWPQVMIDAKSHGTGLSLNLGLVDIDYGDAARAYKAKWGGPQGHETFVYPYNDPTLDFTHVGWAPALPTTDVAGDA